MPEYAPAVHMPLTSAKCLYVIMKLFALVSVISWDHYSELTSFKVSKIYVLLFLAIASNVSYILPLSQIPRLGQILGEWER